MNTVWDKKYIQNDLLNLSADAFITKWFFDTTVCLKIKKWSSYYGVIV